jgi:hypothetical protein
MPRAAPKQKGRPVRFQGRADPRVELAASIPMKRLSDYLESVLPRDAMIAARFLKPHYS